MSHQGADRDPFSIQRRVEFRDTDAAGIVHFSAFFPFMETAEHAFLRSLGLSVFQPVSLNSGDISLIQSGELLTGGNATSDASASAQQSTAGHQHVGPHLSWPRVSASCDYLAAARFEDLLNVAVCIQKLGNSSVTYQFGISRITENDQLTPVANGRVVAVCCLMGGQVSGLQKVAIPGFLREQLQPFVSHRTS